MMISCMIGRGKYSKYVQYLQCVYTVHKAVQKIKSEAATAVLWRTAKNDKWVSTKIYLVMETFLFSLLSILVAAVNTFALPTDL